MGKPKGVYKMNEQIKQLKVELLNSLKAQKQSVENERDALYQQKFAQKKVAVDEACGKLDNVFAQYKQERLIAYNADISKKEEEVKAKKAKLLTEARQTAQSEVISEIVIKTAEFDSEIAKLEKELG